MAAPPDRPGDSPPALPPAAPGPAVRPPMTQASPARRPGPGQRGPGQRGGRSRALPGRVAGRYGLLLIVLIATYLLSAFNGAQLAVDLQIALFAIVLLLALRTSPLPGRGPRAVGAAALAGSLAAFAAAFTGTDTGIGAAQLWKALMLLFTAILIVRRVLAMPTVTIQSIYGALSAYLIIGMMFAACYGALEHLTGAPFFAQGKAANPQTFQYFSFTTLTTLGYGDFTAAADSGRAIAIIEALTGQIFLVTLVARLVAAYRAPAEEEALSQRRGQARPRRPPASESRTAMLRHRMPAVRGSSPAARSRARPARSARRPAPPQDDTGP
ncbi:MAG: potassium channel family protein [Streptosporangiaceae bacterium]